MRVFDASSSAYPPTIPLHSRLRFSRSLSLDEDGNDLGHVVVSVKPARVMVQ